MHWMTRIRIVWLVIFVLSMNSCKKEDLLRDFDKDALFATPTSQELIDVQAAFSQRNLIPSDVLTEESISIDQRITLKMISFRLYGFKQYAAVLIPNSTKSLPVQFYINGFGLNEPSSSLSIKTSLTDTLPFIYVVPSLRGQSISLTVNDIVYKSPQAEGTRNDAFDGATDDVIACLNAVEILFSNADTSRVMVRGGSRGGTVALLMAERDRRVKLAVGVAFPADLLGLTSTHQNDPTYRFQFLDALVNGSSTLEETRRKIIASSPLYFCNRLPKTQMHFGQNDEITPAFQGEMLFNAMKDAGLSDSIRLFIYPNRDHSNIASGNNEMEERIRLFFRELY